MIGFIGFNPKWMIRLFLSRDLQIRLVFGDDIFIFCNLFQAYLLWQLLWYKKD